MLHMRALRPFSLGLLAVAAACSDSTGPSGPRPPRGIVVLNASQAQGVTLLDTTGTQSSFLSFGYPQYDGGAITLEDDTVVTTTSKGGGDQLIITDLRAGTVLRVQLPTGSNPGGAIRDGRASGDPAGFLVALRDSSAVASVVVGANGSRSVTTHANAGLCPVDVANHNNVIWSLDANASCRSTYAVQGPARLVRILGTARDTVVLPTLARGSSGSITVVGDTAFVATSGEADFSNFPNTQFTVPGMIVKVNLATRTILGSRALPAGTYGAGLELGGDGRLYVTAYTATDFSTRDVFAIDPRTLAFTGTRRAGGESLDLRKAGTATRPACTAAAVDAAGILYCVEVDFAAAGASTVYVFDRTGAELRRLNAGQYAADIALR
jgi:hypothetical protein